MDELTLPLHAETISVLRRRRDTAVVRVRRTTEARELCVDEALAHEHFDIERVPLGHPVDAIPAIREEGDTIILPVVKEIVVVERRLVLTEEIRLRRVTTTQRHVETVVLREQVATITRTECDGQNPA